mmetsp:Transcript_71174/g.159294  ORF Transcript_71174/g.159294 Transcript_71174/m.159294 type:complete len:295 (-) Transcript_71174:76-960(-)
MARLVSLLAAACTLLMCNGRRILAVRSHGGDSALADDMDNLTSSNASNPIHQFMPYLPHPVLDGNCTIHDVDNWSPPTDDTCHVYAYRCSDSTKGELSNHNFGDVGWALSGNCHMYGKYLHIIKIEFARIWMFEQPCWDDGVLNLCNGGYTMCNRGPWGSVCGCGIKGDKCGPDPDKHKMSANNFGWRRVPDWLFRNSPYQDLSTCPCNHFSLPHRAKGRVDGPRTKQFLDEQGYDDRSRDAYFQWDSVGHPHVVDIERCLGRHVLRDGWTTEEKVAAFKTAVLDRKEHDCRHP